MSAEHAIDFCVRSQAIFNKLVFDLKDKSSHWCIFDKSNCIISISDNFPEFFFIPKKERDDFPFGKNIVFLKELDKPIFNPYKINFTISVIEGVELISMYLDLNNENCLDLLLIELNNFYYKDNLGNKLLINNILANLRGVNPLDKISQKDWLIAWLIIHDFTTERISSYLNQNTNSVNIAIKRFLGIKKLEVFDRDLFKKIARILGWYNFVPASLVYKSTNKTTVYKDIPLNGTDTKKIFTYSYFKSDQQ